MQYVIGFIAGLFVAFIIFCIVAKNRKPIGSLRVDHSDPTDRPYLFLELDPGAGIGSILNRKLVSFRVKLEDFIPHE